MKAGDSSGFAVNGEAHDERPDERRGVDFLVTLDDITLVRDISDQLGGKQGSQPSSYEIRGELAQHILSPCGLQQQLRHQSAVCQFLRLAEHGCSERQTVGFGLIQPYSNIWSEGQGWLVLIPSDRQVQRLAFGTDEQIIPDRPVDSCWQTNLVHFVFPDVLRWQSLDTGECIQIDYTVLHYPEQEILETAMDKWMSNRPENMSCLPAGKHRFTESFVPKVRAETTWKEFEWRYTPTIEE